MLKKVSKIFIICHNYKIKTKALDTIDNKTELSNNPETVTKQKSKFYQKLKKYEPSNITD